MIVADAGSVSPVVLLKKSAVGATTKVTTDESFTRSVCDAGFAAPSFLVNESAVGVTTRTPTVPLMVKVTGMNCGDPVVAVGDVTVIVALYEPFGSAPCAAVTVKVCGTLPDDGVTVNQEASSDTV